MARLKEWRIWLVNFWSFLVPFRGFEAKKKDPSCFDKNDAFKHTHAHKSKKTHSSTHNNCRVRHFGSFTDYSRQRIKSCVPRNAINLRGSRKKLKKKENDLKVPLVQFFGWNRGFSRFIWGGLGARCGASLQIKLFYRRRSRNCSGVNVNNTFLRYFICRLNNQFLPKGPFRTFLLDFQNWKVLLGRHHACLTTRFSFT